MRHLAITEAPRDALQGVSEFVPTKEKAAYLRLLMEVGFSQIDCVSFVSPKAIPQLRDSAEVLRKVADKVGDNKLLAIVANLRGAEAACQQPELHGLGYPLSLSETFQQRNTGRSIKAALKDLQAIQTHCKAAEKSLLVFLSMGFGNPYAEKWDDSVLLAMVDRLEVAGLRRFSVADTVGLAQPRQIEQTLSHLLRRFPEVEVAVHLHASPEQARDKIAAAYQAGCTRFDAAMRGYGGCPMAEDKLTGNIATETLVDYLESQGEVLDLDKKAFRSVSRAAQRLFDAYAG